MGTAVYIKVLSIAQRIPVNFTETRLPGAYSSSWVFQIYYFYNVPINNLSLFMGTEDAMKCSSVTKYSTSSLQSEKIYTQRITLDEKTIMKLEGSIQIQCYSCTRTSS